MQSDRNLSKGPFKGKGGIEAVLAAAPRRIGELTGNLKRIHAGMGDLLQEINSVRRVLGGGVFRARIHLVGGRFAVRMEWHDTSSSFQLASERGLKLLRAVHPRDREALIGFERRREYLNHQYRIAFAERKSLRQLHKSDQALSRLAAGLGHSNPTTHTGKPS